MSKISDVIQFEAGTPQFRIHTSNDHQAPEYHFYGQHELEADLKQVFIQQNRPKTIRTFDTVLTVVEGDLIYSLISGVATLASQSHAGYLLTKNYVKLIPDKTVSPSYLLYLLNEDKGLKQQLSRELQGSATIKYTLKQLKNLRLPALPNYKRQELIGNFYRNQLHLEALEKRLITLKTKRRILQLKEVETSWEN